MEKSKFNPPDLDNLPDVMDPDNIPGIDYYMEIWQQPDGGYPKCPNHSHELTTKDFVEVANATVRAFGKAWDKSKEFDCVHKQQLNTTCKICRL